MQWTYKGRNNAKNSMHVQNAIGAIAYGLDRSIPARVEGYEYIGWLCGLVIERMADCRGGR